MPKELIPQKTSVTIKLLERLKLNNGNVTKTVKELRTTPKTIRKWHNRFYSFDEIGLQNHSENNSYDLFSHSPNIRSSS
ncbi:MAG: hypothetical protein ABIK93_08340 [candidate division WOR-3 bacterium]